MMRPNLIILALTGLFALSATTSLANELKKLDRLNKDLIASRTSQFCQQTMRFQTNNLANSCCALTNSCGGKFVDDNNCDAQTEQCQIAQIEVPTISQAITTFNTRSALSLKKLAKQIYALKKTAHTKSSKSKLAILKNSLKQLRLRTDALLANAQQILVDSSAQANFMCEIAPKCSKKTAPVRQPTPIPSPIEILPLPMPVVTPPPCTSDICDTPPLPVPVVTPAPSPEDPCVLNPKTCLPPRPLPVVKLCPDQNDELVPCDTLPCNGDIRGCREILPEPAPVEQVCLDENNEIIPCVIEGPVEPIDNPGPISPPRLARPGI